MRKGMAFAQSDDFESAILEYEKSLALQPTNEKVWNLLGIANRNLYMQSKEVAYREAEIIAFEKAIALNGDYWIAIKNLAVTHFYSEEKQRAIPYIKRALAIYPQDPQRELMEQWLRELGSTP